MSKLACPKCKEELNKIIRVIEVRCQFNEEADDYLNEANAERFIDLCPTCRAELETF